ncbi:MAG: glycosyltransferase family 39 protein [Candidatus Aquicultorales bacterium]
MARVSTASQASENHISPQLREALSAQRRGLVLAGLALTNAALALCAGLIDRLLGVLTDRLWGWPSPGSRFFTSLVIRALGDSAAVLLAVQAALGALATVLVYLVARRLFNTTVSMGSAAVYACLPFFIAPSVGDWSRLFEVLLLLGILGSLEARRSTDRLSILSLAGLAFACAAAVQPGALPIALVFLGYATASRRIMVNATVLALLLLAASIQATPWLLGPAVGGSAMPTGPTISTRLEPGAADRFLEGIAGQIFLDPPAQYGSALRYFNAAHAILGGRWALRALFASAITGMALVLHVKKGRILMIVPGFWVAANALSPTGLTARTALFPYLSIYAGFAIATLAVSAVRLIHAEEPVGG